MYNSVKVAGARQAARRWSADTHDGEIICVVRVGEDDLEANQLRPQTTPAVTEVTQLLRLLGAGHSDVRPRLFELIYGELRAIAGARMKGERSGHTLTPTALVHEAYLRLGSASGLRFQDRAHFLATVAQAMRRVLVDHARARAAAKRDPGNALPPEWLICVPEPDERIMAIDAALDELAKLNARQARVIELRYFAGLTEEQVASVLGVTRRTVCRDWQIARTWLITRLPENVRHDSGSMAES